MNKLCRLVVIALALLPLTVAAQANAVGDWTAVFVGPIDNQPKMVDEITFTIESTPEGLTGTARAADWPGVLDVTDVKLEGNRLTFTGTGRQGWSLNSHDPARREDRCCPKLMFDGTIEGDVMKLTLTWSSTDRPDQSDSPLAMEAKREPRP